MSGADDDAFERKIVGNVCKHGCHINYVFDPDEEEPNFAYSVGFPATLNQPEVIVFGLSQDVMGFMINETLRKCRRGFQLTDRAEISGLLEGHRCIMRAIQPHFIIPDYFNSAMWYRRYKIGDHMLDAFQIVWPGAQDGLFPWQDGCAEIVREAQPALYERAIH